MKCRCGETAKFRCECGEWLCSECLCMNECGGKVVPMEDIKTIPLSTDMLFKLIKDTRELRKTYNPQTKHEILSKYKLKLISETLNSILHHHGLEGLFDYLHNLQSKNEKDGSIELLEAVKEDED